MQAFCCPKGGTPLRTPSRRTSSRPSRTIVVRSDHRTSSDWSDRNCNAIENITGAVLGAFAAASLVLIPSPAFAKTEVSLTAKTRGAEKELMSILESRGATLPSLKASPNAPPQNRNVNESSGKELLQVLRRENKEIERLKAELQAAQSSSPAAPAVSAPAPAQTPIPAVDTDAAREGGPLSVLNILGIVAAGILGGYLTIQRKESSEAEETFQATIRNEQGVVAGLQERLASVQAAIDREQELSQKLKQEANAAATEAARQLEMERASVEAISREKTLVERALEAENRLAETMRREAASTQEALDAERAAKFAADAEAAELQRQLTDVNSALEQERMLSQQLQGDAARVSSELSKALTEQASLNAKNAELSDDFREEHARVEQLEAAAAELEGQISSANEKAAAQEEIIDRIGKESVSLREALSVMKAQASDNAAEAQRIAEELTRERAAAANILEELRSEIKSEQSRVALLETELAASKAELIRAAQEVETTKVALVAANTATENLKQEVAELSQRAAAAEAAFAAEQEASNAARNETVTVRSELSNVQYELSQIAKTLATERSEKSELSAAVAELKLQYNAAAERIESEQNTVLHLRRESGDLKKAIVDLESKNRTLAANLQQTDASYRQRLGEAEGAASASQNAATLEREAREDAVAAVAKLEGVIRSVQEEMLESQAAADEARTALNAERSARTEAEQAAAALREELGSIVAAEERARAEAQVQLEAIQKEYETAKRKLTELQTAKPKRAPRKSAAAKKPEEEATKTNGAASEEPVGDSEAAVTPKRRGRPKKSEGVTAAAGDE